MNRKKRKCVTMLKSNFPQLLCTVHLYADKLLIPLLIPLLITSFFLLINRSTWMVFWVGFVFMSIYHPLSSIHPSIHPSLMVCQWPVASLQQLSFFFSCAAITQKHKFLESSTKNFAVCGWVEEESRKKLAERSNNENPVVVVMKDLNHAVGGKFCSNLCN